MTPGFKIGLTLLAALAVTTLILWLNQDDGVPTGGSGELVVDEDGRTADGTLITADGKGGSGDGENASLAPGATGGSDSLVGARTPHGIDMSDPEVRAGELARLIESKEWLAASKVVALMEEPIAEKQRAAILWELRNGRRNQVLHVFSKLLDPSFVEDLFDVLDDPDAADDAKRTALTALSQMPGAPADAVALRLEGRLTDDLKADRGVLYAIASRGGTEAARAMVEYVQRVKSPDAIPRSVLQQLDFEQNRESAEFLVSALETESTDKALGALMLMASRPGASEFTESLKALDANGRSKEVREGSLRALSAIGDEKSIEYLLEKSAEPGHFGDKALEAVGAIGSAEPEARKHLRDALAAADQNPRPEKLKESLLLAIGRVGDREALPAVASQLDDNSDKVRTAAVRAMGRLGEKAQTYVPKLTRLYDQGGPSTRITVAIALGSIGGEQAIEDMKRMLQEKDLSPSLQRTLKMGLKNAREMLPPDKSGE